VSEPGWPARAGTIIHDAIAKLTRQRPVYGPGIITLDDMLEEIDELPDVDMGRLDDIREKLEASCPIDVSRTIGAEMQWVWEADNGLLVSLTADAVQVKVVDGELATVVVDYKTGHTQIPSRAKLRYDPQRCIYSAAALDRWPDRPVYFRLWHLPTNRVIELRADDHAVELANKYVADYVGDNPNDAWDRPLVNGYCYSCPVAHNCPALERSHGLVQSMIRAIGTDERVAAFVQRLKDSDNFDLAAAAHQQSKVVARVAARIEDEIVSDIIQPALEQEQHHKRIAQGIPYYIQDRTNTYYDVGNVALASVIAHATGQTTESVMDRYFKPRGISALVREDERVAAALEPYKRESVTQSVRDGTALPGAARAAVDFRAWCAGLPEPGEMDVSELHQLFSAACSNELSAEGQAVVRACVERAQLALPADRKPCSTCGAQPGEPCVATRGKSAGQPKKGYHKGRDVR